MQHSEKYELVLNYYKNGLWNEKRIRAAIGKWITQEEAEEILLNNKK